MLIKYTWFGDADFSGTLTLGDYARIDSGFYFQGGGWVGGDFNYDGHTDYIDYALIDNAFAGQSGVLAQSQVSAHESFMGSDYAVALTAASDPQGSAVAQLYHTLLHRGTDDVGLAYWVSLLNAGADRAAITAGIMASTEYQSDQIDAMYRDLGRHAEAAGLAYWLAQLPGAGSPRRQ